MSLDIFRNTHSKRKSETDRISHFFIVLLSDISFSSVCEVVKLIILFCHGWSIRDAEYEKKQCFGLSSRMQKYLKIN